MEEIYSKQLEAILFSVNQYSDDILGNWISKIGTSLGDPVAEDSIPGKMKDLLNLNSALKGIFSIDTINNKAVLRTFSLEDPPNHPVRAKTESSLESNAGFIIFQPCRNQPLKMSYLSNIGNLHIFRFVLR